MGEPGVARVTDAFATLRVIALSGQAEMAAVARNTGLSTDAASEIVGDAETAGLDVPAFRRALDGRAYAADVDADRELGKKLNVSVVPVLFVNGRQVRFPYGAAELSELIDRAYAQTP